MSERELQRVEILSCVVDSRMSAARAAGVLGLSRRQVHRLLKVYRSGGATALAHGLRGQRSNRALGRGLRELVLGYVREHYADFGPTLAAEKLAQRHGLVVSRETLRQWMMAAGLWLSRAQRRRLHQPRLRREALGELVQIDGSDHRWFEDRGPPCTLLVFVDDATSRLMAMRFVGSESTFAYFEVLQDYLARHGKPVALYSDKHAIFRVAKQDARGGHGVTQFGRALSELGIEIICANSSQAKGRVERANLTLQERLVKELRLRGISSQKAANAYAPRFVADFNRRFGKPPKSDFDAHRPVRADEDLDLIFTWRVTRKVSSSLTLQHDRVRYLLPDFPETRKLIHLYIDVFEYPDGRIELRADGSNLEYVRFDKLPFIDAGAIVENKRLGHALKVAQLVQAQRDDRRCGHMPSRTNSGAKPRMKRAEIGKKRPSNFTLDDMNAAVRKLAA